MTMMLEECVNRGERIRALEKELARKNQERGTVNHAG